MKISGPRLGPRLICSLLIVLVLVLAGGARTVQAEPQGLTEAKGQAATLEARFEELKDQAAALRGKYESAGSRLAQIEAEAAENAALLAQAEEDQTRVEDALGDRLTQIYKQGRGGVLDVLLSSASFSDLIDRLALLQRIGEQDADLLRQVKDYRARVTERGVQLSSQLAKQQTATEQVEAARRAVTEKLTQTAQSLKGKEAKVAQLEREWQMQQAEQARLQQARQARLDAALAAAQAAAQKANETPASGLADGTTGGTTKTTGATGRTTETTGKTTKTTGTTGVSASSTTGGGQTGGDPSNHASPNILKPEQIALAARRAGFSDESLVIAVAVAMSESGGDANALGRAHTYGLWQILSYAHPNLIDPDDPDASRWYDPYVNAGFAWRISSRGTNWLPWSVYKSGAYEKNMTKARAGVQLLLDDPQAVVPPRAK